MVLPKKKGEREDVIRLAKLIANCKENRLPYLLKYLQSEGVGYTDEEIVEVRGSIVCKKMGPKNMKEFPDTWEEATTPVMVKLRQCYKMGVRWSEIAERVGSDRVSIYKVARGMRNPSADFAERIITEVDKIMGEYKWDGVSPL